MGIGDDFMRHVPGKEPEYFYHRCGQIICFNTVADMPDYFRTGKTGGQTTQDIGLK